MSKILITGANGQIAYELIQLLQANNIEFLALSRKELDITNPNEINRVMAEVAPHAVINAAAYTQVDLAEKEMEAAHAVNAIAVKYLAMACAQAKSSFLHISTDYIFDGRHNIPYKESDPAAPLNCYGISKRQGEIAAQQHYNQSMILRVSGVFGIHGNNFVKTILRLAREREILRVVADQIICPTSAKSIAQTIFQMVLDPHPGIYHYCNREPTTWHAFTQCIVDKARSLGYALQVKQTNAITTAEYPTPAKRPLYSVLDCQKIADTFGIKQPHWEEGLMDVIKSLPTT